MLLKRKVSALAVAAAAAAGLFVSASGTASAGTAVAQAAGSSDHTTGGVVLHYPAAPEGARATATLVTAVSPTISPAVRTEHGAPGASYTCASGNLCLVVWDPTTSDYKRFSLYTCQKYALSNWNGWGNYYDAQTGGVTSYFYDSSGHVLKSFTSGHNVDQDWTPVWSVRNC
ncbi:hypothetical protein [Streptomyces griseoluteus]|uniref:hypothetical protein n=1 Tax=Streptomyces griseoluteus TaxID=29306 RepID=UPI0036F5EC50